MKIQDSRQSKPQAVAALEKHAVVAGNLVRQVGHKRNAQILTESTLAAGSLGPVCGVCMRKREIEFMGSKPGHVGVDRVHRGSNHLEDSLMNIYIK